MNRIVWIRGGVKTGKTTLARLIAPKLGAIILDGDDMRESVVEAEFGKPMAHEEVMKVARLAKVLLPQTSVVVAVAAPEDRTVQEVTKLCNPSWFNTKDTPQYILSWLIL